MIKKVGCEASYDTLFSISVDNGQSWKYFNNNTWNDVASDLDGIPTSMLENITSEQWSELITEDTPSYQFRCVLPSKESYVGKIYIKYI